MNDALRRDGGGASAHHREAIAQTNSTLGGTRALPGNTAAIIASLGNQPAEPAKPARSRVWPRKAPRPLREHHNVVPFRKLDEWGREIRQRQQAKAGRGADLIPLEFAQILRTRCDRAIIATVYRECRDNGGVCRLRVIDFQKLTGVCERHVQRRLKLAEALGLITIERRREPRQNRAAPVRNKPNVIRPTVAWAEYMEGAERRRREATEMRRFENELRARVRREVTAKVRREESVRALDHQARLPSHPLKTPSNKETEPTLRRRLADSVFCYQQQTWQGAEPPFYPRP